MKKVKDYDPNSKFSGPYGIYMDDLIDNNDRELKEYLQLCDKYLKQLGQ